MKRHIAALFLLSACATTKGDKDTLKPTLEAFHSGMRWKDLRSLSQVLMPDKREGFDKAVKDRDDEKNLFVSDYSLEDCKVALDVLSAVCYSKVSWYRLPSISEKTVTIATTLRWKGGLWLIEKQSDGPFAEELSLGSPPDAKPDAGAVAPN